jgi:hypothetical protein
MGDDDLDLLHVGHCRGMTTDAATGLSRATARCSLHCRHGGLARHRPLTGRALPPPAGPRHADREVQAACRRGR